MGKNVLENLKELSLLAKLIVSFSLESIKNKEFRKEVRAIYEQIKNLEADTMRHLFKARIPAKERIEIINLVDRIADIAEDAKAMASFSLPNWVKIDVEEKVFLIRGKKLAGKRIDALKEIAKCIGIKRKGKWIPAKLDEKIRESDILALVGTKEDESLLRDLNG